MSDTAQRPLVVVVCDTCGALIGNYRRMPEEDDMTGFDDDWVVSNMACNRCEDGRGEIQEPAPAKEVPR